MNDPVAKSRKNARRMILSAFRYVGSKKNAKTYEIIGLDAKTFEQWLRDVSRVKPETHNVHIDHVIPISWAQSQDEVLTTSSCSPFTSVISLRSSVLDLIARVYVS